MGYILDIISHVQSIDTVDLDASYKTIPAVTDELVQISGLSLLIHLCNDLSSLFWNNKS